MIINLYFRFKISSKSHEYYLLEEEEEKSDEEFVAIYVKQAELIRTTDRRTMLVDLRHLFEYDKNYELRELIVGEFSRFQPYLEKSVEDLMKKMYFEWASKKLFTISFYNVPEPVK